MRRILPLLLCLSLSLTACAATVAPPAPVDKRERILTERLVPLPPVPETPASPVGLDGDTFTFTWENFPKLDGSTSTVPLAQAIALVLLGESREEVGDLIRFSKTTQSYQNLLRYHDNGAKLLLAAEPPESIWKRKDEIGFAWKMEPFAIDGLVFMVNANNPVDSLTADQVRKIYAGEITNWKEVGGDDVEIVPFQRNEEAGSQTIMQKVVMKDVPIMEPPSEHVIGSMGWLIEAVRSYSNSTGAIGYTVYYYAHDMRMAEGLKLLKIDGYAPNADTFRSGAYPFTSPYYVVTAAEQPEYSPALVLYHWILSEEGQALVEQEGYVPAA